MTQHQDAAHRVARFLEGYARMRQLDQDVITGVAVGDDDEPRDLLVQDLKILCYTAFNTPSTPESLAADAAAAAAASQLVTGQYASSTPGATPVMTLKDLYDALAREISRSERPNDPALVFRLEDGTASQVVGVTTNSRLGGFFIETADVPEDD